MIHKIKLSSLAVVVIAIVAITLVGFWIWKPISECANQFCVGMVLPLSGPVAEYGTAIRNGVTIAQNKFPHRFSRIKFLYEDSQYIPARAVSAFKRLKELNQADLIYTFGGSVSEVVAPIGQQLKVATLISSIDPAAKIGKEYVLRFSNPSEDFGSVLVKELRLKGARDIAIVLTENHYLNSLLSGLSQSLQAQERLQVLATYQPADQDFKTVVAKLRHRKPDILGIFLLPGQVASFYRELNLQNVEINTFGSDVFESSTEISAAGENMRGAFFANHDVETWFREQYKDTFGNDHQIGYAGQAYDLANFLGQLFSSQKIKLSAKQILHTLRTSEPQQGVTGQFSFIKIADGDEYFSFPIRLRKITASGIVSLN